MRIILKYEDKMHSESIVNKDESQKDDEKSYEELMNYMKPSESYFETSN